MAPVAVARILPGVNADAFATEAAALPREGDAVRRLAGGVAHEFNNLLTVIAGYTELLADRLPPNDPALASAMEIRRAAMAGASITGRLLAVSQRQVLSGAAVDINELVQGLVQGDVPVFHNLWKTGTSPVIELEDTQAIVSVDRDQMTDALRELASNACDAMPNGGTLTIATSFATIDGREAVRVSVRDTGCGMTDDVKAKCTEPFFSTKPIGKGRGLGLAAVRGFVEQIGGAMAIASTPNGGTEVSLVLPCEERTKPRADGARPRL